jgi:hypothetical protein
MLSGAKKKKPTDGSDNSDENTYDEQAVEEFVSESEKEYYDLQQQKKYDLEKLKKERGFDKNNGRYFDKTPTVKYKGDNLEPEKTFTAIKNAGIFDNIGRRTGFKSANIKNMIQKKLKLGSGGIALKKQREFMQLLNKYHSYKTDNLGTLDKGELKRFEVGLYHGNSDAQFKKFSDNLKKDGIIQSTNDVKRLFNKREIRRMGNVLLGRKDNNMIRSIGKLGYMERKGDMKDSGANVHN